MPVLEVSRDIAGLAECAAALLDYEARRSNAGKRSEMVQPPPLSSAHLGWVKYLLDVERMIEKSPALAARLPADVMQGLTAIAAGRQQFRREHKQCQHCGRWASIYAPRCACGEKL